MHTQLENSPHQALKSHQDGGFPSQLSLTRQTKPQMPIPAVDFSKKHRKALEIS